VPDDALRRFPKFRGKPFWTALKQADLEVQTLRIKTAFAHGPGCVVRSIAH